MAVPTPTFGPNGFITPTEPEILVAVKEEINAAFGGDLNMADETPQGQLAVSQTAAIGNANDAFTFLSQQMDPAYNVGRYQDAIARIYFIERFAARPTVVTVRCIGGEGVIIPVNAIVMADDGTQYLAVDGGEIPPGGSIDLQFACAVPGPIPCPAGSIQTIYQQVSGWDQAFNPDDGVLGRNTERREEFEERRRLSVANNAQGSLPAILGSVLTASNVLDAFVTENVNATPLAIRGYTLGPNSLYVAAVGGTDYDVGKAIWRKKSPGCGYNGNTTVTVYDDSDVYTPPYPAYEVKFERPSNETVIFTVSLIANADIPDDALAQIQAAIVAAFAGADGGPRARIGSVILASRFYGPVSALGAWVQIISIKIGCSNAPDSTFQGSILDSVLTVTSVDDGVISVGQTLVGDGVVAGTTIISGSGLVWTVDIEQTVAAGTIRGVTATLDEVIMEIDQSPVTAPGDTYVVIT